MNRIIFGGGFDPIHLGHINMAIMAQKAYPGEVIFVPAKIAVWKSSSISQEHKLAMVQIAIKNIPGFSVDTFELVKQHYGWCGDSFGGLNRSSNQSQRSLKPKSNPNQDPDSVQFSGY